MKFVFLMDPLDSVVYEKDTTFILMKEASRQGHTTYFLSKTGLHLTNEAVLFDLIEVIPTDQPEHPFDRIGSIQLKDTEIDVVFIRTDPPFDSTYLMHTWILDRCSSNVKIVNKPSGIRTVNEKLWVLQFKESVPPTLVSSTQKEIFDFLNIHQKIVIKPTDGFGGQGVVILEKGDRNSLVLIEVMTKNGLEPIIAQVFVPESVHGDKRILLLNGDPLGAALRKHSSLDHRNNFFAGGSAESTEITSRDLELIHILKPYLVDLGLFFVGIDIMGDYLIEVNVTSPTCLQEMNKLYNKQLERHVIEALS